jgi:hypothetical protein
MEALEAIDKYFRSGNSIPVERATIRREEWEALKNYIDNLNQYCRALEDNLRVMSRRVSFLVSGEECE